MTNLNKKWKCYKFDFLFMPYYSTDWHFCIIKDVEVVYLYHAVDMQLMILFYQSSSNA